MAAILRKSWQMYNFIFDDLADQRLRSWPFIGKPLQVFGLLALYLMFVTKWGPNWMKNRKPFQLKKVLILYNSFQIAICSYIFVRGIQYAWGWDYKWICQPVDYSNSVEGLRMAKITYLYFLTKVLDLLDTVFFVLRKKNKQVSFLHLYHHAGMVVLIGGAATYFPGGHCTFIGVINSFVHVMMYSYYLLTSVYPTTRNIQWYKKLITQIQILQFFCIAVHTGTLLFPDECEFPRWSVALLLPQNLFLTALFTDFYIKTYITKPKSKIENNVGSRYNQVIEEVNRNKDVIKNGDKITYSNNFDNDVVSGRYKDMYKIN